jgi:hypothetical protein
VTGFLWNGLNTLVGFVLALAGGAELGSRHMPGVWVFKAGATGFWRWWFRQGWAGITIGQVIIFESDVVDLTLLTHELRHVWQQRRWGPLFFPAYGVASLLALARGGHAYRDNPFEVDARKAERA